MLVFQYTNPINVIALKAFKQILNKFQGYMYSSYQMKFNMDIRKQSFSSKIQTVLRLDVK